MAGRIRPGFEPENDRSCRRFISVRGAAELRGPRSGRYDALVRSASAIHSTADQGSITLNVEVLAAEVARGTKNNPDALD